MQKRTDDPSSPAHYHARWQTTVLAIVLLMLTIPVIRVGLLRAEAGQENGQENGQSATEAQKDRLREGSKIVGLEGKFKITGDRAMFATADGKRRFGGLENLNLERVMSIIRDDPNLDWKVDGVITEYRGVNYLLITRAVRQTKASAPVTRTISSSRDNAE